MSREAFDHIKQPGHTAPVAAVKNYIRRMIQDADISCSFRFSRTDSGSCVQTEDDGSRVLIIGIKELYDHAERKLVVFQKDVPDGLPAGYEKDDRVNYESVGKGMVQFARDDDAVWLVKACAHELEHLKQQTELFPDRTNGDDENIVRMCIDDMLHRVIPEHYDGSYHVMAHEIDADEHGVRDGSKDLAKHCGDIGLVYGRCKELMLDRLEREPQLYGEQQGPDFDLEGKKLSGRVGKTWPERPRCRSFSSIKDVLRHMEDYDIVNGSVNGLSSGGPGYVPSALCQKIKQEYLFSLASLRTQDETRKFLMDRMVEYGMLEQFDDAHIAGFSMWPDEAKAVYEERVKAKQKVLHDKYVASADKVFGGVQDGFTELSEHVSGGPLIGLS